MNRTKEQMKKLIISQDDCPESPREWDNLGTMVCFHSRYELGDRHDFSDPEDFKDFLESDDPIRLPLYLLDHSGLWMRSSRFMEYGGWDTSMVGFIYITKEQARKEYGWKVLTKARIEKILTNLESEVKTYGQYLEGDVYGFSLIEETECTNCHQTVTEILDSCGGFYGSDPEKNGMKEYIPNLDQYEIVYK